MANKKKRSVGITAAWIGATATIVVGLFTLIPKLLPDKQIPTLPYVDRYDDPSELFSIDLPSAFVVNLRYHGADKLEVDYLLDEERLNFDAPKKNYHYISINVSIYPLPDGIEFDEYVLKDIRTVGNVQDFSNRTKDFVIFDVLVVGDSTVISNQKTDKGFIIKSRVDVTQPESMPDIVMYELRETDATGFSDVTIVMNEQAYIDFDNAMDKVIHSYSWKPYESPK